MSVLLGLIFFLSGACALLFETLWFFQSGLALGNSIWASSLVLAAFMGGLATGNGVAAVLGQRLRRPLVGYAALEGVIGIAGIALVVSLPLLTPMLAPFPTTVFSYWPFLTIALLGLVILVKTIEGPQKT